MGMQKVFWIAELTMIPFNMSYNAEQQLAFAQEIAQLRSGNDLAI